MIDERALQLLNAELDSELSAGDRIELDAMLMVDAGVRREREELRAMIKGLHRLAEIDPPAELGARILSSLQLPDPVRRKWQWPRWELRPLVLPFASLATAFLVLVTVYNVPPNQRPMDDLTAMVGTALGEPGYGDTANLGILKIDLAELDGKIRLVKPGVDDQRLEFELNSSEPVDIAIQLANSGLEFGGITPHQGGVELRASGNQVLQLRSQGRQDFSILLEPSEAGLAHNQAVGLEIMAGQRRIYQGLLSAP